MLPPHSTDANDLELEERLDAIDPLRHLRGDVSDRLAPLRPPEDVDSSGSDDPLLPAQPSTIVEQTVSLAFPPIVVQLNIDASPGCGGVAWPAGEVLSRYLVSRGTTYLKNKTVLELGSGTGLVGLVAALLGAPKVFITDQAPLLNLMRNNVALNETEDTVSAIELNWGEPLPALPHIDLVIAADCVYFEPAFPLLVNTLAELVPEATGDKSSPRTEVLFCYKKRRKADKRFFQLLKKKFDWHDVSDHPERESYTRDAISLLRLTRRPTHV